MNVASYPGLLGCVVEFEDGDVLARAIVVGWDGTMLFVVPLAGGPIVMIHTGRVVITDDEMANQLRRIRGGC